MLLTRMTAMHTNTLSPDPSRLRLGGHTTSAGEGTLIPEGVAILIGADQRPLCLIATPSFGGLSVTAQTQQLSQKDLESQRGLVQSLRSLANFIEQNPTAISTHQNVHIYEWCPGELHGINHVALKDVAKSGWGPLAKEVDDSHFALVKRFGPRVLIRWFTDRKAICKLVKVGTKVIAAEPEKIIPAKPERVEDIVEWQCPDSLIADDLDGSPVTSPIDPPAQAPEPAYAATQVAPTDPSDLLTVEI